MNDTAKPCLSKARKQSNRAMIQTVQAGDPDVLSRHMEFQTTVLPQLGERTSWFLGRASQDPDPARRLIDIGKPACQLKTGFGPRRFEFNPQSLPETQTQENPLAVSVSFFNANVLDVTAQVNNGGQFTIAAAAPPAFAPQQPTSGGPTWSNTGPSNNVLGPGENHITITPTGITQPFTFPLILKGTTQYTSIQLYVFWNGNNQVSWVVLNNGQYVDGSVVTAKPAHHHKK